MDKIYTEAYWQDVQACNEAIEWFMKTFPDGATMTQILAANPRTMWVVWLLLQTEQLTRDAIKAGADVHMCDDYALRWAGTCGHVAVVKILEEHIAKENENE